MVKVHEYDDLKCFAMLCNFRWIHRATYLESKCLISVEASKTFPASSMCSYLLNLTHFVLILNKTRLNVVVNINMWTLFAISRLIHRRSLLLSLLCNLYNHWANPPHQWPEPTHFKVCFSMSFPYSTDNTFYTACFTFFRETAEYLLIMMPALLVTCSYSAVTSFLIVRSALQFILEVHSNTGRYWLYFSDRG